MYPRMNILLATFAAELTYNKILFIRIVIQGLAADFFHKCCPSPPKKKSVYILFKQIVILYMKIKEKEIGRQKISWLRRESNRLERRGLQEGRGMRGREASIKDWIIPKQKTRRGLCKGIGSVGNAFFSGTLIRIVFNATKSPLICSVPEIFSGRAAQRTIMILSSGVGRQWKSEVLCGYADKSAAGIR